MIPMHGSRREDTQMGEMEEIHEVGRRRKCGDDCGVGQKKGTKQRRPFEHPPHWYSYRSVVGIGKGMSGGTAKAVAQDGTWGERECAAGGM